MNTHDKSPSAVDRIHRGGDVDALLHRVTKEFRLGKLEKFSIIEVGLVDCNVDLQTDFGRFVVKIFNKEQPANVVSRYVNILEEVVKAGVAHPALKVPRTGLRAHWDELSGNLLIVMDYVDGQSFFSLARPPTRQELAFVVEQAAKIHTIDLPITPLFDPWAVPNIKLAFENTEKFIGVDDRLLVNQVLQAVQSVQPDLLSHALVHGDLIKTNVMLRQNGGIAILDFGAANRYPRIQDLAVITANLMYDGKTPLVERVETVADLYSEHALLNPSERRALHNYALGAVAMEYLGSLQEKYIKKNSNPEIDYWLELGRTGLQEALKETVKVGLV